MKASLRCISDMEYGGYAILNGSGEAVFFYSCPYSFLVIQPNISEDSLPLGGVFFKGNSKHLWMS